MWRILAALALLVGLVLAGRAYTAHCERVGYQRAVAEYAAQAKAVDAQREAVSAPIVAKEAAAQVQIRTVTKTLIEKVPIYVKADDCAMPAGFRVLHDAAAVGKIPDPARIADAAAVPAQEVAGTLTENYGLYFETSERLRGLQEWVRAQEALSSR